MKRLDHIVLWTKNPRAAMDFYTRVVGLEPVRFAEFEAGEAPFPSVRVCEDSIIDLSPIDTSGATDTGQDGNILLAIRAKVCDRRADHT